MTQPIDETSAVRAAVAAEPALGSALVDAPSATAPSEDGTEGPLTDVVAGITPWTLVTNLVISLAVVLLSLSIYHLFLSPKPVRFGKVNLGEVLEIKQIQFSLSLLNADVANKASVREDAINQVAKTGADVEKALNALSERCQCTLLVTGAVLSSQLPDYTNELKSMLGIGDYNLEALRKRAADAIAQPDNQQNGFGARTK